MRIGLISDTHIEGDASDMPCQVFEAFAAVDLILHCGDISSLSVLDRLETICPVIAVPGYSDPRVTDPRLDSLTRVLTAEGVHIGLVHHINWPGTPLEKMDGTLEFPSEPIADVLRRKFGSPVDVVAFGDSHKELIAAHEGILFVNPGSPTYPAVKNRAGDLGTVAILSISRGKASAEIIHL